VNALPIVNAGSDQTVCQGTNVTLTATGATTYSWSGNVTNGIAFTPSLGTTTYTVSGTSSGCTATDQVVVISNATPLISAGADQAVCEGTSITLTATGDAATYSWSGNINDGVPFLPIGTTTYTLTGTSSANCTATDNVVITVNTIPAVNAGPDVAVCDGSTIVLNATGADTYSWDNSISQNVGFVPALGTMIYTVVGTIAGCEASDQVEVTVNPNPTPFIQGDLIYCAPTPPTLSTDQVYAGYSWSTGSGNATIIGTQVNNPISVTVTTSEGCQGTSPSINLIENNLIATNGSMTICEGQTALIHGNTVSIAGDYAQTYTSVQGCDSTSTITLIVNPLPNVNAGPDQSVCSGTSITVSGSGANAYTWNNGVTNGVPFTPSSDLAVICTGTDLNGCVNTDEVLITVNPNPIVNAGIDQAVCAGSSVILSGSGANTYSWNNSVTNDISFVPMSTMTYTVSGTTTAGCTGSDQVVVTVNNSPNVSAGQDQIVCEGSLVTLTATGAATYSWNNNINNGIPFVPAVGTNVYTVTGTSLGCSDTDQVTVTVNPNPVVTFTADQTLGCIPLTVNFTNTSSNSSNCVWSFSNGTTQSNCSSAQVVFDQGGCFDVTLTTTTLGGCEGTFTAFDIVCAEEPPVASFTPNPQEIGMFDPLVNFNNTTVGASTYSWDFGDNSVGSTLENPSHLYPNEAVGNYDIMLVATSGLGCADTAYSYVEVIEELIYYIPNTFTPDNDIYNQTFEPIFTSGFDPYDYTLLIFNRWGEIIFESRDHRIGWDGSYGADGDIKTCQEGVYTWRIEFKVRNNDERKILSGHVNLLR
jgi:gliding motility-associated-like protein